MPEVYYAAGAAAVLVRPSGDDVLNHWLGALRSLRCDRSSGGPAPHKPLLLLSLLDLVEESGIPADGRLELSPELVYKFMGYWTIVADRWQSRPDPRLPFFYMRSDNLWSPLNASGEPTENYRQVRQAIMNQSFASA